MATSYTYQNALARVAAWNSRAREDTDGVFAINDATSLLWNAYDFPFTKADLPPIWLTSETQDYGALVNAIPADFKGLRSATLVDTDSEPIRHIALDPKRDLDLTGRLGQPEAFGYVPEKDCFRVHPRPPFGYGPGRYLIIGKYKKTPPLITRDTLSYTMPWEDEWFNVYCTALEWALTPNADGKKIQLLGLARSQAQVMASAAGLDENDPPGVAPREPLVAFGRIVRLR